MLDNLSQREKVLLIVAVIIIAAAGYYFYIYQPLLAKLEQLKNQKQEIQNQLNNTRMKTARVPKLKEEKEKLLAEKEKKLEKFIDFSVLELLINMREFARANNVVLKSFRPREQGNNITMNVTINGDYQRLSNFFLDLMNWEGPFEYQEMRMQGKNENLTASLNIKFIRIDEGGGDDS